jgi:cytochrome c oxidase subunit 4
MSNNTPHISEYLSLGKVLVILLFLTFITIFITQFDLQVWNVTIALVVACVKVFLVLSYFMHLKYEGLLFKILVGMVFLLFFLVIVITFIDYLFR